MTSSRPFAAAAPGAARPMPPPAQRPRAAASYSRFIPREELRHFDAWTPHAFGAVASGGFMPLPGHAQQVTGIDLPPPAAPGAAAATPVPFDFADDAAVADLFDAAQAAEAAPAQPARDIDAELAAARQSGYQDGYRDGLVALDSFKESYAQQMTAQIGQLLLSFDREIGALEQRIAASVARVATELARQVVRSELTQRPALVAEVARQAVAALTTSARHVTVQLHPDDLTLVAAGCGEALEARGARLLGQSGIERGGCIVDADIGQIDASIGNRWHHAAEALGSAVAWSAAEPATAERAGAVKAPAATVAAAAAGDEPLVAPADAPAYAPADMATAADAGTGTGTSEADLGRSDADPGRSDASAPPR